MTGAITIAVVSASAASAHAAAPKVIVKSKPAPTTGSTTAVFRFGATKAGGGSFWCQLDAGPWLSCRSPERYVALGSGRHTIAIRATGHSVKPVTLTWTVHPAGRSPKLNVTYLRSDPSDIVSYNVVSPHDGASGQVLRVLQPTKPAPGVPHNFLYVLPVEPGVETTFGDGIETLARAQRAEQVQPHDRRAVVSDRALVRQQPVQPEHPVRDVHGRRSRSLGDQEPATTGKEQNWLLGFSKSGLGAQDLILKHPGVFTAAASWDFPANMDTPTSDDGLRVGDGLDYGSDANFQANYRLTPSFVAGHSRPFQGKSRIWIGGYDVFGPDVADYDALLTANGIAHTTERPQQMLHRWESGWVPIAVSALSKDGAALPPGP